MRELDGEDVSKGNGEGVKDGDGEDMTGREGTGVARIGDEVSVVRGESVVVGKTVVGGACN